MTIIVSTLAMCYRQAAIGGQEGEDLVTACYNNHHFQYNDKYYHHHHYSYH